MANHLLLQRVRIHELEWFKALMLYFTECEEYVPKLLKKFVLPILSDEIRQKFEPRNVTHTVSLAGFIDGELVDYFSEDQPELLVSWRCF